MSPSILLNRLTLRQLRYFSRVAQLGSVTKAAEELHMSQPPLTMAMRKLEENLGVTLLERDGRGIRLTPAGEELAKGTEQVFELLDRLHQRLKTIDESGIARLTVGITDDFTWSPLVSRLMTASHGNVTIAINTIISTGAMLPRQLLDGIIGLALTVASTEGYPKGLVAKRLPPSRIMALVPINHDLARESVIQPSTLANERMILMSDDSPRPFAQQCAKIFRMADTAPTAVYQVENAPITQLLVEEGLGIGLVSEFSARDSAKSVRIPLKSRHAALPLVVRYHNRLTSKFVPILVYLIA